MVQKKARSRELSDNISGVKDVLNNALAGRSVSVSDINPIETNLNWVVSGIVDAAGDKGQEKNILEGISNVEKETLAVFPEVKPSLTRYFKDISSIAKGMLDVT